MLLGAILKHKLQFTGYSEKNKVELSNIFYNHVFPELEPYFSVRCKAGTKKFKGIALECL